MLVLKFAITNTIEKLYPVEYLPCALLTVDHAFFGRNMSTSFHTISKKFLRKKCKLLQATRNFLRFIKYKNVVKRLF